MMATLSLADRAADYITAFTENPEADRRKIATMLAGAADGVASGLGFNNFVGLSDAGNVVAIANAVAASREGYARALQADREDAAGAFAAVHLMSLNLIGGLDQASAAKQIAELAAYLYSQEFAYRQTRRVV